MIEVNHIEFHRPMFGCVRLRSVDLNDGRVSMADCDLKASRWNL
jgi:hypothetical protein